MTPFLQEKLSTYKPAFPQMQQLKSQIDEIDKQIQTEVGNIKASVRSEYEAMQAQESMLQKQMDVLKTEVLDQQTRSIRYNVLKREVDTNRQLYAKRAVAALPRKSASPADMTSNNISVVDQRQACRTVRTSPALRFQPDAGVVSSDWPWSVFLALVFEYASTTPPRPPRTSKSSSGLAVLGDHSETQRHHAGGRRWKIRARRSPKRTARCARRCSSPPHPDVPRTLLVTSSVPGKVIDQLPRSRWRTNFAQLGKRVLLIDADLRNPSLHRTLGLERWQRVEQLPRRRGQAAGRDQEPQGEERTWT